jgi:hypothetical protein
MGRKITGMRLPANVMFTNGDSSVKVGSHFSTGFTMNGIIESLEQDGETVLLTFEGSKDQVLLFGSGAIAELARPEKKPEAKK